MDACTSACICVRAPPPKHNTCLAMTSVLYLYNVSFFALTVNFSRALPCWHHLLWSVEMDISLANADSDCGLYCIYHWKSSCLQCKLDIYIICWSTVSLSLHYSNIVDLIKENGRRFTVHHNNNAHQELCQMVVVPLSWAFIIITCFGEVLLISFNSLHVFILRSHCGRNDGKGTVTYWSNN